MELNGSEWRKASRSSANGGNCVEVSAARDGIFVRDSKDRQGPVIFVSRVAFQQMSMTVRGGSDG
ncbi:DUF397 domain-containing protein [Actinomadura kijaniata]|uniref:DUF397 domain-containing protein n=1 Tax=Actinomadura kijaniata TaxID=46161 RepID=UPI0009FD5F96|nr:DUF397 domain-containing protein [Actinomadura kijaniata]